MRVSRTISFVLILAGLWASAAFCAESPLPESRTQKKVLDNGLTVLVTEMPDSPTSAVYALVNTGGATEGEFLGAGLTHFVEHMLFKGTHGRSVGEIAAEVQSLGGVINATTGLDYTYYMINVPHEHADRAVEILSDMLLNSVFDEKEIEREREVIFNEMRMHNDRPARVLSRMVFETVYRRHPYRIPVIGFKDLLAKITRDDFLRFYRTRYIPNNMIFSVAGPVKAGEVFNKVESLFGQTPRAVLQPRNLPAEPPQTGVRRVEKTFPTNQTRLSLAWRGVNVTDKDMPALDVLAVILGRGRSSRLFRDLFTDKGLVQSVRAYDFTPIDPGVFEISSEMDQDHVEAVIQDVKQQIASIAQKGVSEEELAKVKTQVISEYIFDQQSADNMAYLAAVNEVTTGDIDFSRRYLDMVKALTVNDIQDACARYLTDDQLTVSVLRPEGQGEPAGGEAPAEEAGKIKKLTLANGLTVLLRKNSRLPIVSFSLVLDGGTRFETPQDNGISELTSRLWTRGTAGRTSAAIDRDVESRGGQLSGISGRNSLGLRLNFLSQDRDFALGLLEDLVKNPSFDTKELAKVKEQVQAAILSRDDRISSVTGERLRKALFGRLPIALEVLGTKDSVAALTAKDIAGFYRKHRDPSRMVLSVFGDIDPKQMEEEIRRRFGRLPDQPDAPEPQFTAQPVTEHSVDAVMDKKQAMLMIGYRAVAYGDKDRYAMSVLSAVLGSPFNGRIFNQIRDQSGKAYSAGGSFAPTLDAGLIQFYALTDEDSLDYVEKKMLGIIAGLREKGISADDLEAFKTYLKGTHEMGLETDSALGFMSALDELYGLGYDEYEHFAAAIDAVTPQDIQRLARDYLAPEQAVVVRMRPSIGEGVPSGSPEG